MATNDTLLLDGLIDDLLEKEGSTDRGKVFEFFALGQILKEWDLSVDELASGWTDGRQDGGIDGFYVLVNGHCIRDISDFIWPRVSADIVVHIVTCKHADTFVQATLDALIASLTELLDLSVDDRNLKGAYSKALLTCRARLLVAYRKLAPRLASFKVNVSYASRGNLDAGIGVEVKSRAHQILSLIHECFHDAEAGFDFIGATQLIELYRRRPKSNVRDFMGLNRVNEDIAQTLSDRSAPDFWWLNNGVTILATNAWSTSNTLHMENVQIVNGLQTTESIFRHFSGEATKVFVEAGEPRILERRAVMVKVISSVDDDARDRIVRATNNQTSVEQISLHATEKIQRDIEEALIRVGLHYERRKNFYVNQGVSFGSIITPMYLAAGLLALGKRREPWSAVALKQRHLRKGGLYDELFSETTNLRLLAPIASVLKAVDSVLEEARPLRASEGFLKNNRFLLALLAVARKFGTFNYTDANLAGLDCDATFVDLIRTTLAIIPVSQYGSGKNKGDVYKVCESVAEKCKISHIERIRVARKTVDVQESVYSKRRPASVDVSAEFIDLVFANLPAQPWKPGIHAVLSSKLSCTLNEYFAAVEQLIASGRALRQQDGILYAPDGSVQGYDPERVIVGSDGALILLSKNMPPSP